MTVGENIKKIREKKGMTQKELADKCNIIYQTIGKYERDLLNPKYETLQKIATALGVSTFDLLDSKESEKEFDKLVNNFEDHIKFENNKYITKHNLNQLIEELSNIDISFEYITRFEEWMDEDASFPDASKDILTFEIFNDHLGLTLKELKQIKKACEKAYNDCLKLKFYEAYLNKEKPKGEEIED